MNICLVCLRVDKRTKVNTALSEFHRGLCAFKSCGVSEIYYCTECEYLMMKFYKFKQKCVKALEIYQLWSKYDRKEKNSIKTLYKFMPPPSIDVWRPHPKRIGSIFIKNTETEEDSDIEIIEDRNINKEKISTTKNIETNPDPKQNSNPDRKQNGNPDRKQNGNPDRKQNGNPDRKQNVYPDRKQNGNPDPKQNGNIATKSAENKGYKDITRKNIEIVDTIANGIEIVDSESEEDIPNNSIEKEKSVENTHQDITRKDIGIANSNPNDLVITVNSEKDIKATEKDKLNCYNTLQQLLSNAYIDKGPKKQVRNNEGILFDDDGDTKNLKNNVINKIINKQEMDVMNYKMKVLKKMKDMTKCRIKKDKRLAIEELTSQLSVFGELATPTGLVIEKGLLLMLATHEAGDVVLDKLKNTTCREDVLILSQEIEFALDTINSELVKKEDEYRTVFDIELLNTQEQKMAEFERRKCYECYVNTKYKCETCYRPFKSAAQLEYHMRKVHVGRPGNACCRICRVWHGRKHTHSIVFMCKLCPLVTYSRNTMINHYEWHKGTVYTCKVCRHISKSRSAYAKHMERHGGSFCGACGRGFQNQHGLIIHKTQSTKCNGIHRPAYGPLRRDLRCDMCDVTFPSEMAYSCHMKSVHKKIMKRSGKGTISCPVCKVVSRTGYFGLVQHFRKEHPAENLQQYYVHQKKFLCDICGRAFSTNTSVKFHRHIHTGERAYPCDLCTKTFRTRSLVASHRVHHFPPSLPCNTCGKKFKTNTKLNTHSLIHTNVRKHKCHLCEKAFRHGAALKEHIQGVHQNIRRVKKRQTDVERRNKISVIEINDITIVKEKKQATYNLIETQARESDVSEIKENYEVSETTENCDVSETIEKCEVSETNSYDIPETIEKCEVETAKSNESLETIDNNEDSVAMEDYEASETLENYEDSEILEIYEDSETLDNYEVSETLENYEVSGTLENCDVSETIESWDTRVCEDDTETMDVDEEYETEVLEDWDEYDAEIIIEP